MSSIHYKPNYPLMTVLLLATALASGCGGGGGGGASTAVGGGSTPTPTPIQASATYAQQCSANNPYRADASGATISPGTLTTEKQWVRAYINEAYLWYSQVPTVDATLAAYSNDTNSGFYTAIDSYFKALKTTSTTASGALTDKFSFTYPTKDWKNLSQSGVTAGYGIEWVAFANKPPRRFAVAFVQPGSPAASAGLARGDELVSADGVDFVNGSDTTTLNNALFPATLGEKHNFVFHNALNTLTKNVNLASASITITPVPIATVITQASGRKVGYLQFTDHIATAEAQLITAISNFKTAKIDDLVLDMRYNGGGYLFIASELAYMIAGSSATSNKWFERLQYNDKRTADNAASPTPYYNTACILDANFNCTSNQALPTLNLPRVFVIGQGDTCSASESVINGLQGAGIPVHLIGAQTCGKPYGFTAKDNCGISYFPIEFKGINYKGFGDYSDGFIPGGKGATADNLPGCTVKDDLTQALGDVTEGMFKTTLSYMVSGACPAAASGVQLRQTVEATGSLVRPPVRASRLLLPGRQVRPADAQ